MESTTDEDENDGDGLDCALKGITDDTGIELVEEVDVVEIFVELTMDFDGTKEVPVDSDEVDGIGEGDT